MPVQPDDPPVPSPGRSWAAAAVRSGGEPGASAAAGAELEDRYDEPHRSYHTGAHAAAVVRDCAWLAGELHLAHTDPLVLAACAHDVVYAAHPGEDERASASWARNRLSAAGVDDSIAERVAELIRLTATHEAGDGDRTAAVLLDADLAILGSTPERYTAYVAGVRAEYAAVPEHAWRTGRAAVLHGFLARPALFVTGPARSRWEATARRNVAAELTTLDRP